MNLEEVRNDYFNDRFERVLESLRSGWSKSGLPNKTGEWAEACHLGMISSFRFANEAERQGDRNQEQRWEAEAELWRARSLACALHSGNLSAGALNIIALGMQARYEGQWTLAVDIAELVPDLLDAAEQMNAYPPLSETRRIHHEARAISLCDAHRKENAPGALDDAIKEGQAALQYCKDDLRAELKVKGGIANMTYWRGDKEGAIAQTRSILEEAESENLQLFAEVARRNLDKMGEDNDDLVAYQVA